MSYEWFEESTVVIRRGKESYFFIQSYAYYKIGLGEKKWRNTDKAWKPGEIELVK
jgi:hypothetical protein